jgi:hypothetical protein
VPPLRGDHLAEATHVADVTDVGRGMTEPQVARGRLGRELRRGGAARDPDVERGARDALIVDPFGELHPDEEPSARDVRDGVRAHVRPNRRHERIAPVAERGAERAEVAPEGGARDELERGLLKRGGHKEVVHDPKGPHARCHRVARDDAGDAEASAVDFVSERT